jgi:tetratricopeptide (TPR) repeat protein
LVQSAADPLSELAASLQELHHEVGEPSYRKLTEIADRQGRKLSRSTIGSLFRGESLPKLSTVEDFVATCREYVESRRLPDPPPPEVFSVQVWRARHERARRGIKTGPTVERRPIDVPYTIEPYELRTGPPLSRHQPSRLLAANNQVVAFVGREAERKALVAWRDDASAPAMSVLLLHGSGGQGKTRLASRFAELTEELGWSVLQARHNSSRPGLSSNVMVNLPAGERSKLVIVDYAERWPRSDLLRLVQDPVLHPTPQTRILLVARPAGHWWHTLAYDLVALNIGLDVDPQTDQLTLSPLASTSEERHAVFIAARDTFAEKLGVPEPDDIPMPGWLEKGSHGHALTIHMAALAAVDAHARGAATPSGPALLSSYLLDRERAHWQAMHESGDPAYKTADFTMARAVFTAVLVRPQIHSAAVGILDRAGVATTVESASQVLRDHGVCYPSADEKVLEPIYPDRLAEDLVALQTPGSGTAFPADPWADEAWARLLRPGEDGGQPSYTRDAVTTLVEAAHRWPHLAHRQLFSLLRKHPELALEAGSATLVRLTEIPDIDVDVLFAIEEVFPDRHLDLDIGMVVLTERLVRKAADSITDPIAKAALHRRLARHLYYVGRTHDALLTVEKAVEILRPLAWEDPQRYIPELANTLTDYGASLADLGRNDDAIAVTRDAIWFWEQLLEPSTGEDRYRQLPHLAASLGTLSGLLTSQSRPGEALDAVNDAIALLRPAAADSPALFEPDLARGFANQSRILASLGRWERALMAATNAVLIWRLRAAEATDEYQPDLALALHLQAERMIDVAQWDEALEAVTESVSLLERASEMQPDGYLSSFGSALQLRGAIFWERSQWDAALAAAVEVVEIRRALVTLNDLWTDVQLANALLVLSNRLCGMSRGEAALAAAKEGVEILHRAADDEEDAFVIDRAWGHLRLSEAWASNGEQRMAVEEAERSIELVRRHAADDSATLERVLLTLSDHLTYVDRAADALALAREAVDLFNERSERATPVYASADRLWVLNALAVALVKSSQAEEAVTTARRAVATIAGVRAQIADPDLALLAGAHDTLSVALAAAGQHREALRSAEEGVRVLRGLVARSGNYEAALAGALTNLAQRLADEGRWQEACATVAESVRIRRRLAAAPGCEGTVRFLARSLWQLAYIRLSAGVEIVEAVAAADESVAIYGRLRPSLQAELARERRSAAITLARALEAAGRGDAAAQIRRDADVGPQDTSDVPAEW